LKNKLKNKFIFTIFNHKNMMVFVNQRQIYPVNRNLKPSLNVLKVFSSSLAHWNTSTWWKCWSFTFPWKQVKVYWLARMGRNFDDYPGLQPKITPPKHFSRQCTSIGLKVMKQNANGAVTNIFSCLFPYKLFELHLHL
jgi:hypothetical protein